jgi:uncharacterized protein YjbJ (UPF0337 family)
MNKDQIKGRVEEIKGKVKEAVGVVLDDDALEIEGNVQKNVGKVQKGFGDLKEDIKKDKLYESCGIVQSGPDKLGACCTTAKRYLQILFYRK